MTHLCRYEPEFERKAWELRPFSRYCLSNHRDTKDHLHWSYFSFNPFPSKWVLRALIDFTLSNARRFYSSMGNLLDRKGLRWKTISSDERTETGGIASLRLQDAETKPCSWGPESSDQECVEILMEMVFRDDDVNNGDDNADSHDELNDDGRNWPLRHRKRWQRLRQYWDTESIKTDGRQWC